MNNKIFYFFYNFSHQSIFVDQLIIFCAQVLPYIVVVLVGLFLLFHHEIFRSQNPFQVFKQKYREILFVFFSGILAWIFSDLLKLLINTDRPFNVFSEVNSLFAETGFAFPSTHTSFFIALGFSIFFSHKKAGYVFILLALIIGLARVAAGVHFPIDILGGFILGIMVAYLVKYFSSKFAPTPIF